MLKRGLNRKKKKVESIEIDKCFFFSSLAKFNLPNALDIIVPLGSMDLYIQDNIRILSGARINIFPTNALNILTFLFDKIIVKSFRKCVQRICRENVYSGS